MKKPSQLLLIIFFAVLFIPMILSRELDLGIISMSILVSLIGCPILYFFITLALNIYSKFHSFWFLLPFYFLTYTEAIKLALKNPDLIWQSFLWRFLMCILISNQFYAILLAIQYKKIDASTNSEKEDKFLNQNSNLRTSNITILESVFL